MQPRTISAAKGAIYGTPGYHMNKKYWNTVVTDTVPKSLLQNMITHSYKEVVKKLPKNQQKNIPYTFGEPLSGMIQF